MNTKSLLILAVLMVSSVSQASVIAVIDSGTDVKHTDLKAKIWTNAKDLDDAVDNDNNTYIDDTHGWNFADGNNKLIDKKFLGTFSSDIYKYFEVQTRMLKGQATAEDIAWLKSKRDDKAFIAELGTFGNFVHGTHVAGIAAAKSDAAQIMGLKIIPTRAPQPASDPGPTPTPGNGNNPHADKIIRMGLKALAAQQGKMLAPVSGYVKNQKARLANCSFGTSTMAAKMILKPLIQMVMKHEPTDEEMTTYASVFVTEIMNVMKKTFVDAAPNTLFVMAAGNDGTNNDELPTSPANIKSQNTITVAATYDYVKLASFSNYGAKLVELAAPGVGILSSIPGNEHITVSGTSQAAPFVAGVAGAVLDTNPKLTNLEVKELLMQTVDAKSFLKDKVVSGGIVNASRALRAAKLSLTMTLSEAIRGAKLQIGDVNPTPQREGALMNEGYVMPLPTLFTN